MIWLAPTESKIRDYLTTTEIPWKTSDLPEKHGCDILIPTKKGVVGFQRKTLPDLVSSIQDGRLYYELSQLNASATVAHSYLIVESMFVTTIDGNYAEAQLSVSTLHSIIAKFHAHNVGFLPTQSPRSTVTCCLSVSHYIASGKSGVLHRPKQVTNEWGQSNSKSYGVFLLQSFPGIGPKVAEAIYDHFNGVPIQWAVNAGELALVPGVGRKRAEALVGALRPGGPIRPD